MATGAEKVPSGWGIGRRRVDGCEAMSTGHLPFQDADPPIRRFPDIFRSPSRFAPGRLAVAQRMCRRRQREKKRSCDFRRRRRREWWRRCDERRQPQLVTGVQEFRSSGVQVSSGVQEFRTFRTFLKSELESQARHLKIPIPMIARRDGEIGSSQCSDVAKKSTIERKGNLPIFRPVVIVLGRR